jgi:phage protein D
VPASRDEDDLMYLTHITPKASAGTSSPPDTTAIRCSTSASSPPTRYVPLPPPCLSAVTLSVPGDRAARPCPEELPPCCADRPVAHGRGQVPHPVFVLSYEQKNITNDITPYVRSVTYTDYLSGQSDELEVELEDADGRWVRHWYPGKGDTLSLKIGYEAAPLLPCGAFEIDEIEFAQPPATVSIRGLATGVKKSVRTRVGRAYENTTLAAIAQRIAKRNKLTLTGKIRDIRIDRVTQYQERDVEFLTRLAREYGYAFKIVSSKLVFTELADLRDGGTVATFKATDLIAIRLRDKIKDIYQEAKVKYHDPKTKKLVVYGVKGDQVTEVGQTTASTKKQSANRPAATR